MVELPFGRLSGRVAGDDAWGWPMHGSLVSVRPEAAREDMELRSEAAELADQMAGDIEALQAAGG